MSRAYNPEDVVVLQMKIHIPIVLRFLQLKVHQLSWCRIIWNKLLQT